MLENSLKVPFFSKDEVELQTLVCALYSHQQLGQHIAISTILSSGSIFLPLTDLDGLRLMVIWPIQISLARSEPCTWHHASVEILCPAFPAFKMDAISAFAASQHMEERLIFPHVRLASVCRCVCHIQAYLGHVLQSKSELLLR